VLGPVDFLSILGGAYVWEERCRARKGKTSGWGSTRRTRERGFGQEDVGRWKPSDPGRSPRDLTRMTGEEAFRRRIPKRCVAERSQPKETHSGEAPYRLRDINSERIKAWNQRLLCQIEEGLLFHKLSTMDGVICWTIKVLGMEKALLQLNKLWVMLQLREVRTRRKVQVSIESTRAEAGWDLDEEVSGSGWRGASYSSYHPSWARAPSYSRMFGASGFPCFTASNVTDGRACVIQRKCCLVRGYLWQ